VNDVLTIALLFVGLINVLVAAGVFNRSTKDVSSWTFLLLISATSLWAWGIALFVSAQTLGHSQVYLNMFYFAALFIGASLVAFGRHLKEQYNVPLFVPEFLAPLAFAAIVFIDPTWLVTAVSTSGDMNSRVSIDMLHYSLYGVIFLLIFTRGWLLVSRGNAHTLRQKKRQVIVSIGVLVSGFAGVLLNLILPWLGHYEYIAIGPLFTFIFTASITYAISKYSLFDLRQSFLVSLAYLMASISAVLIYILTVWVVGAAIVSGTSNQFIAVGVYIILALAVAMTINPLRGYFDTMTNKLFFREHYRPEEALDTFGDAIIDDVNIDSIAAKIIGTVESLVHPMFAAVIVGYETPVVYAQPENKVMALERLMPDLEYATQTHHLVKLEGPRMHTEQLRRIAHAGIGIVVRMQLKDQVVGYIIVGEKRNGDSYNTSESFLLSTMADESSLVIMNSLRLEEIQAFNKRLKTEISSATQKLRSSNKKLIELDATKDEFVSMASHQLRTPLTSVKGYISMVLEGDAGKITPQQRQLLGEAYSSSERMVHLIGDFLNVSRLQTGKFVVDRHEVDLALMTKQEVEGIKQIAVSHSVKLECTVAPRIPLLYLDEAKMRQVMMNFIDNAIYYSPAGSTIRVKLAVEEGDIVFTVKDEGIGVPPEVKDHLFTRFFRAENARKQRPDGTGIGLYLAKKIIDGHGGHVTVESKVNKGSTFGFRLPIVKLSKPQKATQ
jgi:signal transduction histidine kinase